MCRIYLFLVLLVQIQPRKDMPYLVLYLIMQILMVLSYGPGNMMNELLLIIYFASYRS